MAIGGWLAVILICALAGAQSYVLRKALALNDELNETVADFCQLVQETDDGLRGAEATVAVRTAQLQDAEEQRNEAFALLDRYRRIGFSPCKDESCYRATLTMMQEADAFLCQHEEAAKASGVRA
jgi:hypothetical protein